MACADVIWAARPRLAAAASPDRERTGTRAGRGARRPRPQARAGRRAPGHMTRGPASRLINRAVPRGPNSGRAGPGRPALPPPGPPPLASPRAGAPRPGTRSPARSGSGQPASVGSAASMPTPVGSAALPAPVGPALAPSAREDPGSSSRAACARTASGKLWGPGGACGRERVGAAARAPARCPRRARPAAPGQAEFPWMGWRGRRAQPPGWVPRSLEMNLAVTPPSRPPFPSQESPRHSGD